MGFLRTLLMHTGAVGSNHSFGAKGLQPTGSRPDFMCLLASLKDRRCTRFQAIRVTRKPKRKRDSVSQGPHKNIRVMRLVARES